MNQADFKSEKPVLPRTMLGTSLIYSLILFVCCAMTAGGADAAIFVLIGTGLSFATILLAAAYAVFGTATYWRRTLEAFLLLTVVGCGGFVGLVVATNWFSLGEIQLLIIPMPAIWVAAQIPMLIMRIFFGWRLSDTGPVIHQPISILDVMVFTAVVAISLALMQLGTTLSSNQDMLVGFIIPSVLAGLFFAVVAGCPAVYLVLNRRPKMRSSGKEPNAADEHNSPDAGEQLGGCVYLFVYFVMLMLIISVGLTAVVGAVRPVGEALTYLMTFLGSLFFFTGVPLTVYKDLGVRLVRTSDTNLPIRGEG